jgi:uncharacterized OsmC-like protein
MTDSVSLNGVDLARIGELKAQFKENPDSSRVGFTAHVRWLGGFRTESTMTNHSIVRGDEPTAYAGQDSGPSPEDMLLAAVGQCLAVGYASTTAARGIALRSLEIEVRGKVNFMVAYGLAAGNPGFDGIEVTVRLDADGPEEQLRDLHERVLAEAPIPNTVRRPVKLDVRLDIVA